MKCKISRNSRSGVPRGVLRVLEHPHQRSRNSYSPWNYSTSCQQHLRVLLASQVYSLLLSLGLCLAISFACVHYVLRTILRQAWPEVGVAPQKFWARTSFKHPHYRNPGIATECMYLPVTLVLSLTTDMTPELRPWNQMRDLLSNTVTQENWINRLRR